LIPPVTFDRWSGKFPPMKAWIYIYATILAAGMLTALADEARTNTQAGATTSIPANTNQVAVPSPTTATSAPAPAVVRKVKSPAVVPLTPTSAVPAPSNSAAAFLTTTNASTLPPLTTSTSAPAVTGEESLTQTNAVPAPSNTTAAPPPESSEIGWKGVLAISVLTLAVLAGLAVFLLSRSHKADHASLITRALSENKDEHKDEEKHEDKKETKKFPPPMT